MSTAGKKKRPWLLVFILLALVVAPLISLSAAGDPEVKALYPLSGALVFRSAGCFLLYYLSLGAYYFGWEFLFRGFGFFPMCDKYGPALAIAVSTMISVGVISTLRIVAPVLA